MSEEELLAQIRDLLEQYLAMGTGTPVEAEAQALAAAIDGTTGGGAAPPTNGAPPEDMGMMMSDQMPPMPDMQGMEGGNYGSFSEANDALKQDLKKKIKGR